MQLDKKYEVIILRDLKFQKKKKEDSLEKTLEDVLNEYDKSGYKVVTVWGDAMIMEKESSTMKKERSVG